MSVDQNAENGLAGPNIVFTGANIHMESGSDSTLDSTGLGNLVIGYDEANGDSSIDAARTGSHNLVIGPGHKFTASGALLAGNQNISISDYTVAEGERNVAGSGAVSSCPSPPALGAGGAAIVSGGIYNTASGEEASISGGSSNTASGGAGSVSGGESNTAGFDNSTVGGGVSETTTSADQNIN